MKDKMNHNDYIKNEKSAFKLMDECDYPKSLFANFPWLLKERLSEIDFKPTGMDDLRLYEK